MGSIAEELGYFGADPTPGEGGESLQIIDTQEAWVFHIRADGERRGGAGEAMHVWTCVRVF